MTDFTLRLLRWPAILFCCFAGAWASAHQFSGSLDTPPIVWLSSGVTLAFLLLLPRSRWLPLALISVVAELLNSDFATLPPWLPPLYSLLNLSEALLAAWLIRRVAKDNMEMFQLKGAFNFLIRGPIVSAAVIATLASFLYSFTEALDTGSYSNLLQQWRMWWFGDALGMLLVTPTLLVLARIIRYGLEGWDWRIRLELAIICFALFALGLQAFQPPVDDDFSFHITPMQLIPFCLWVAVRLGVRATVLSVALVSAMTIVHLHNGIHPYPEASTQFALWLTQEYLSMLAIMAMGLAILLHELRQNQRNLEHRVIERTASLNEANQRLEKLVSEDFLTGIANRRHFQGTAERSLQRLEHAQQPATLIMFDLDDFKGINDRYGHEAGDLALQSIVQPVQQCVRPMDLFGRMGGEEFMILLPQVQLDTAERIAERIRQAIAAIEIEHKGRHFHFTSSFGIALWHSGMDLDHLMSNADHALYAAKEAGRNCVRTYRE